MARKKQNYTDDFKKQTVTLKQSGKATTKTATDEK